MSKQLEDRIERILLIAIFALLALKQALSVSAAIYSRERIEFWQFTFISRLFSLAFLLMIVVFTLTRLPAKDSAGGIEPRLTAIGGTFAMMLLVVLPTATVSYEARLVAAILIVVGTMLSTYCLAWLGQSFAILASARRLVTHGPYAVVRHPLYAAEGVTIAGAVIANWSFAAVALGLCTLALQVRRMFNEERVLRAAFPDYADYATRVPMILPWPRPGWLRPRHQPHGGGH